MSLSGRARSFASTRRRSSFGPEGPSPVFSCTHSATPEIYTLSLHDALPIFESLFRALNRIGYAGPLSIEWEDSGMDRDWGAPDALAFVRRTDFAPSAIAFDAAMQRSDG